LSGPITESNLFQTLGGFGVVISLPSGSEAKLICGDKEMLIRVANQLYELKEKGYVTRKPLRR